MNYLFVFLLIVGVAGIGSGLILRSRNKRK